MPRVTVEHFSTRISQLLLDARDLPRRSLDFAIVLISSLTGLALGVMYAEGEINAHLQQWILQIGPSWRLDHSGVRCYLVDGGFLTRDKAGWSYSVNAEGHQVSFDPEILCLDLGDILTAARQERLERKRRHLAKAHDE